MTASVCVRESQREGTWLCKHLLTRTERFDTTHTLSSKHGGTRAHTHQHTHTHTHTREEKLKAESEPAGSCHSDFSKGRGIPSKTSGREGGISATAMALATVWNYCVPLTIITVACLARTGKALLSVWCVWTGKSAERWSVCYLCVSVQVVPTPPRRRRMTRKNRTEAVWRGRGGSGRAPRDTKKPPNTCIYFSLSNRPGCGPAPLVFTSRVRDPCASLHPFSDSGVSHCEDHFSNDQLEKPEENPPTGIKPKVKGSGSLLLFFSHAAILYEICTCSLDPCAS